MPAGLYSHGFTIQELFAPQVRCSYPSKVCNNSRAVKLCGSLHKLCEFHRKKAILNQKRLQQRCRVIRAQMTERASLGGSAATHLSMLAMKVNLMNFLKSDSLPSLTVTMANKDDTPFAVSSEELSVFNAGFLDNFMFVGSTTTNQAAPTGYYDTYSSDQVHGKYEAFNFELHL